MAKDGWVSVQRGLRGRPWLYEERREFSKFEAWIFLLHEVRFKPIPGSLDRGELQVSINALANVWLWNRDRVYRFLHALERAGELAVISPGNPKLRIPGVYKIVNFDEYNGKHSKPNSPPNSSRTGSATAQPALDLGFKVATEQSPQQGAQQGAQHIKEETKEEDTVKQGGSGVYAESVVLGDFGHTRLTDSEFHNLQTELGPHFDYYVGRFDAWVHEGSAKAKARNPFLTIRSWYRRDVHEGRLGGTNGRRSGESNAEARERRTEEAGRRAAEAVLANLGGQFRNRID